MVVLAHQITHFFPADAIRWTKQPEKPTILEEGRTLVHLVWKFLIEGTSEGAEILRGVTFRRQRDAGDSPSSYCKQQERRSFYCFSAISFKLQCHSSSYTNSVKSRGQRARFHLLNRGIFPQK